MVGKQNRTLGLGACRGKLVHLLWIMNILVKILVGGGHSPTSPIAHSSLGFAMSNKIYKVSHFFSQLH